MASLGLAIPVQERINLSDERYTQGTTGSNTTFPKETRDEILQSTMPILLRRRPARYYLTSEAIELLSRF